MAGSTVAWWSTARCSPTTSSASSSAGQTACPSCWSGTGCPRAVCIRVTADDQQRRAPATRHLIGLGHRQIAHIHNRDGQPVWERYLGYVDALTEHRDRALPGLAAAARGARAAGCALTIRRAAHRGVRLERLRGTPGRARAARSRAGGAGRRVGRRLRRLRGGRAGAPVVHDHPRAAVRAGRRGGGAADDASERQRAAGAAGGADSARRPGNRRAHQSEPARRIVRCHRNSPHRKEDCIERRSVDTLGRCRRKGIPAVEGRSPPHVRAGGRLQRRRGLRRSGRRRRRGEDHPTGHGHACGPDSGPARR